MAANLHLKVLFDLNDKISKPMRYMSAGSQALSESLKQSQKVLKAFQQTSANISSFQRTRTELKSVSEQYKENTRHVEALNAKIKTHADTQQKTTEQIKVAKTAFKHLSREMARTSGTNEALNRTWHQQKTELEKLHAQYGRNQSATRNYSQQLKKAHQHSKTLGQQQSTLKNKLEHLKSTLGQAGISVDQMATHQRRLRGEMAQTNTAIEQQIKGLNRLAQTQALVDKIKAGGDRLKEKGQHIYEGSRNHMAFAGGMLTPGMELDAVLSKVQALTGLDKDSEAMKALRADARAKGASTSFSAVDVAQGQAFLAQAGFKAEQIIASTQAMLDVARAGDVDLARAADITSNISSAFAIDPGDTAAMTQLADQLVAGFTNANMSLEDLGETMKYFAPIAKAANMDTATSIAMTGMLGNVGIQGGEAGTALRTMTTRLAALPTDALKELDTLGVSSKDGQGNLRNMADILADLDTALQSHGSGDKLASLKKIFGQEALSGMSSLMETIGQGQFAQQLNAIRASQGAAAQVARTMADNLSGDMEQLRSAAKDLSIGLFDALSPVLRALSQALIPLLQGIGQWMAANPALAKTVAVLGGSLAVLITAFGALTMTLGLSAAAFAHALPALIGLKTGLLWLGKAVLWLGRALMANPIGLAITAIGLAAYLIYKHWEPISEFFRCMWEVIKDYAVVAWNGLKTLLSWTPHGLLISNWSVIAEFMQRLWDGIWRHIKIVWNLIAGIFTLDGARILDALTGLWELINGVLMGWPEKFQQFGIDLLQGFIGGIKNMAGAVGSVLTNVVGGAVGRFKDFLGIRSPSRLFAGLGGFTLQGYTDGLERSQNEPVQAVLALGQRLRQAASGIVLGTSLATTPVMAATANNAHRAQAMPTSTHYEIHIHAAPGQDAQAIATAVRTELDRREHERQARARSAFFDD